MEQITHSLETSLKSCSLNNNSRNNNDEGVVNGSYSSKNHTALVLNSGVSLPYQWEQCLDLKQMCMKLEEEPRRAAVYGSDDYYSEDDNIEYDSKGSYSESISPHLSPTSRWYKDQDNNNTDNSNTSNNELVVDGCKNWPMYYMVAKQQDVCLKCNGQLMHFNRSKNGSP